MYIWQLPFQTTSIHIYDALVHISHRIYRTKCPKYYIPAFTLEKIACIIYRPWKKEGKHWKTLQYKTGKSQNLIQLCTNQYAFRGNLHFWFKIKIYSCIWMIAIHLKFLIWRTCQINNLCYTYIIWYCERKNLAIAC